MKTSEAPSVPASPLLALIRFILNISAWMTAVAIVGVIYLKCVDLFLKDWFCDNEFMASLSGGAAFVSVTTLYIIVFATLPALALLSMTVIINKVRKLPAFAGLKEHARLALINVVLVAAWVVLLLVAEGL